MIYYVTAVSSNGDEWVISTHDSADEATTKAEEYKKTDDRFEYRVDVSEVARGNITATNRATFNEWRTTAPHPIEPARGDFQLTELFGWYDGTKAADRLINCNECGAVVSYDNKMMETHRQWHNKLLP